MEGGFDEGLVAGGEAEAGGVGVGAEDAIVGGDGLAAKGAEGEELLGEFGPSAAEVGHFSFVEGGSDGL